MAAATAEMLANGSDGRSARSMLTLGETAVNSLQGARPAYLVFNATHLDRWIGHTLVILGDTAAEQRPRQADEGMDGSFTRALGVAQARRGERVAAA